MTRRCFFVPHIDADAKTADLSPGVSHHVENVLRLRVGDAVEVRDGEGNSWTGEIASLKKGGVCVRLLARQDFSILESPLDLTLALGLARSDIMDLVVRQATEMGVRRLAVFRAARSQYGLTGHQAEKKKERWSKIAREAICQCGRTKTPRIAICEDLERFLGSLFHEPEVGADTLKVFARERTSGDNLDKLRQLRSHCPAIVAAIGPEGGWDPSEIAALTDAGFMPVGLGPRVLRFETAALALISSIQLLWGDMGEEGQGGRENEMH